MNETTYKNLYYAFVNLKGLHEKARLFNEYDFKALNYYANIIENIEKQHKNEFNQIKDFIMQSLNVGDLNTKRFI